MNTSLPKGEQLNQELRDEIEKIIVDHMDCDVFEVVYLIENLMASSIQTAVQEQERQHTLKMAALESTIETKAIELASQKVEAAVQAERESILTALKNIKLTGISTMNTVDGKQYKVHGGELVLPIEDIKKVLLERSS